MVLDKNAIVVVADGHSATFFRNISANGLELAEERNLTPTSLADDGPAGRRPPESSPRETDEATFAKQLSQALSALVHNTNTPIVIIADPGTLGQMRASYSNELQNQIVKEIDKHLVGRPKEEIERVLARERIGRSSVRS